MIGLTGIDALEAEMRDRLSSKDKAIASITTERDQLHLALEMSNEYGKRITAERDGLAALLREALKALSTLPMDALGFASSDNDQAHWPIRDELMYRIDSALTPSVPDAEKDGVA